jgi:hypothetical protein
MPVPGPAAPSVPSWADARPASAAPCAGPVRTGRDPASRADRMVCLHRADSWVPSADGFPGPADRTGVPGRTDADPASADPGSGRDAPFANRVPPGDPSAAGRNRADPAPVRPSAAGSRDASDRMAYPRHGQIACPRRGGPWGPSPDDFRPPGAPTGGSLPDPLVPVPRAGCRAPTGGHGRRRPIRVCSAGIPPPDRPRDSGRKAGAR